MYVITDHLHHHLSQLRSILQSPVRVLGYLYFSHAGSWPGRRCKQLGGGILASPPLIHTFFRVSSEGASRSQTRRNLLKKQNELHLRAARAAAVAVAVAVAVAGL